MDTRCLWLIWLMSTALATALCTVGCLLPYWLKGHVYQTGNQGTPSTSGEQSPLKGKQANLVDAELSTDLGLFRRCGYPAYHQVEASDYALNFPLSSRRVFSSFQSPQTPHATVVWRPGCGHYSYASDSPHIAWDLAFFAMATACGLLFFTCFFISLLGFAVQLLTLPLVWRSCQVLELIAGLLTVGACLLYPAGWQDNMEIRQACGNHAGFFKLGRCNIGWAYVLTCSGGLLALLTVLFSLLFPVYRSVGRPGRHHKAARRRSEPPCDLDGPRRSGFCFGLLCSNLVGDQYSSPSRCSSSNLADGNPSLKELFPLRGLASPLVRDSPLGRSGNRRPTSVIVLPSYSYPEPPWASFTPPDSVYGSVSASHGVTRSFSASTDQQPDCIRLKSSETNSVGHQELPQTVCLLAPAYQLLQGHAPPRLVIAPGRTAHPPAHQRYSTGTLLSHFYLPGCPQLSTVPNGGTVASLRTTSTSAGATVLPHPADPLIDVFEEEEEELEQVGEDCGDGQWTVVEEEGGGRSATVVLGKITTRRRPSTRKRIQELVTHDNATERDNGTAGTDTGSVATLANQFGVKSGSGLLQPCPNGELLLPVLPNQLSPSLTPSVGEQPRGPNGRTPSCPLSLKYMPLSLRSGLPQELSGELPNASAVEELVSVNGPA